MCIRDRFTGTRFGYTVVPRELVRQGASLRDMWLRRQSTKYNGVSYPVQRAAQDVYKRQAMHPGATRALPML